MQLDLNLLTALDALLEEGSVTGAAERLHLSAPAMSRTLGRIRRATGDEVLVREGRAMRPTARAQAMREEVRSLVLRSQEVLAPEADLDLATLTRTFTIQGHDALISVIAPRLVARLATDAPHVALRFLTESRADTTDLGRGLVDLEVGSAVPASPEIAHDRVSTDALVGLARPGHPLFDGDIDVAAWSAVPHITVSRRGRLRDRADELLHEKGRTRTVVASVASTAAAIDTVQATDAVVIVPASVAQAAAASGAAAMFPLPIDLPDVALVMSWHRRLTPDRGHAWLRGLARDALISAH
ncbi:LysR family transcriptional regulator [Clavibacter michiganensis]|nr:LysR family transcriptional regulator [Clavibacter michiganensis]